MQILYLNYYNNKALVLRYDSKFLIALINYVLVKIYNKYKYKK